MCGQESKKNIIEILGSWMDANRRLHYRIKMSDGNINPDVLAELFVSKHFLENT